MQAISSDYGRGGDLNYWRIVLPYYLKVSFLQSGIGWAGPLAYVLIATVWDGAIEKRLVVNWFGLRVGAVFGGILFLLTLVTAIADDIHRNWGREKRIPAWNPALMWKVFIYLGAGFFFVAAFLAYHQGVWLSVFFIAASIGCFVAAKKCL